MLKFEKPEYKVTEYVESSSYGKFELEPLERGFGTTLGNALRRVMLSSLPGSAITSIKIDGVLHEFQTIEGVVEDVTSIILNLKGVVIKNHSNDENKTIRINVKGEKVVTAADFETDSDIEIINKDQVIATVSEGGKFVLEATVGNGRGYVRCDEQKSLLGNLKVGVIPIDSLYSPIERISYEVENARVGQNENYDKLIMNVWTNGAMKPEEAIALAGRILVEHLEIVTQIDSIADVKGLMNEKVEDPRLKTLQTPIEDLDFSVRAYNCLKRASLLTVQDITNKSENEMMKIRNLGKKSLKEVIDKIKDMGLKFRDDD
ncbi:MAG: DNA-directed RNA polymerase subunit alpha [Bacilli bacterium]|nr:DNA-directed RNA polymerase subunit alpha [Bacilli bacterium]